MTRPRRSFNLIWLLLPAILGLYLIGNDSVSLWDRDEPRYAQTSRQMLQSGDWVVPKLLDEPRLKKPIFIYWCQAAAMKLFGENTFAARFPSAIFVTATVGLLAFSLRRTAGPRRAIWTAFIFATSGLTIAAAKMCITDGVLILFITAMQLCLGAILLGNSSWPIIITLGFAVGFGLLTKGPVALGVMGVTYATYYLLIFVDWFRERKTPTPAGFDVLSSSNPLPQSTQTRSAEQHHPAKPGSSIGLIVAKWLVAISLAIMVLGPWIYAIEQRVENFTINAIRGEVIERGTTAQEGHKGPPGFYLMLIWVTYFPWSLLLPAAIISGWKNRKIPHIRFALAAVIGPWLMLEFYKTKLPHYALPIFPPLAFLTADMLIRAARKREFTDKGFLRVVLLWSAIIFLVSTLPLGSIPFLGATSSVAWFAICLLPLLALELGRTIYIHFSAGKPLDAALAMGVGMILIVAVLYRGYLPYASFMRISNQVADVLIAEGATYPGAAIMIDYKETSLPFYQGGTIRPQRENNFLEITPPIEWPRWIVLTDKIWNQTPEAIKERLTVISKTHGLNYADGGRELDVLVVRTKPTATTQP